MILDLKNVFEGTEEEFLFKEENFISNEKENGRAVFPSSGKIRGEVVNKFGIITLTYSIVIDYQTNCDRCLKDIKKTLDLDFSHQIVKDINDEEDDGTFIKCEDGLLDLDELVYSDLVLTRPAKNLCETACKGLCSKCGMDLNTGTCDCDHKEIDPRLAVLATLLKDE